MILQPGCCGGGGRLGGTEANVIGGLVVVVSDLPNTAWGARDLGFNTSFALTTAEAADFK